MPDLDDLIAPYAEPEEVQPVRPRKSPQEVRAILNQVKADFKGEALRQADIAARRAARAAQLDPPPA